MNSLNQLKIFTFIFLLLTATPIFAKSILTPLTDSVNSGIINTKIEMDDSIGSIDIDATVINGIAVFSGDVRSMEDVRRLIRIAHSVSGIKGVDISKIRIVGN